MDENSRSERLSVRRKPPSGILRIDVGKPRRLSGGSVEFKTQPELLGYDVNGEPVSPASSASCYAIASPQLSVKWANQQDDTSECSHLDQLSDDQTSPLPPPSLPAPKQRNRRKYRNFESSDEYFFRRDKEILSFMESLNSPLDVPDHLNSDEDDYSVSVSAIMQRRASTRGSRRLSKKGRRASSPLDSVVDKKDRRRSSVYTTSSGETAITMEENTNQDSTQEQIFENIRVHKEVLQQVKWQPWSMKRKLKLVQQAKSYIARHEGELQERFASSKSTKDILARFKIVINTWFSQRWQHFKRELANFSTVLIPWELRIKEIESHFGSVVASYFTFLRWLFWVNIVIGVVLIVFLAVPELIATELTARSNATDLRKKMSESEKVVAGKLITIWDFEGNLKYSPLFYGFYAKHSDVGIMRWYNMPLAYFLVGVAVYIYSFYATLSKMAENSRMSKLSSKDDECTFSWKIFTGWDFMIGHAETAANRLSSVILGFKEALLEESEKKKDARNWKVICLRIFVNLVVLALLILSAGAVIFVVADSKTVTSKDSWWRRNEITLVLSTISFFFPMFFEALGLIEYYHPRQQLRIQLARIMVLNLLNLYSLIFALFDKIKGMSAESDSLRPYIEPQLHGVFANGHTTALAPTTGYEMSTVCSNCSTTAAVATTLVSVIFTTLSSASISTSTRSKPTTTRQPITTTRLPRSTTLRTTRKDPTPTSSPMTSSETTSAFSTEETSTSSTPQEPTEVLPVDYDKSVEHYYFISDSNEDEGRQRRQVFVPSLEFLDYDDSSRATGATSRTLVTTMMSPTSTTGLTNSSAAEFLDYLTTRVQEATTASYLDDDDDYEYDYDDKSLYEEDEEPSTTTEQPMTTSEMPMTTSEMPMTTSEMPMSSSEMPMSSSEMPMSTLDDFDRMEEVEMETSSMPMTTTMEATTPTTTVDPLMSLTPDQKEQKIRSLCWETMFGQELVKLTVMDLIVTIGSTMLLDFFRALFVRYLNGCWCWDLEKQFPQYGDFKIAENILHLVNNQGMVWMGMFFSPGLALINLVKLGILMYLRSWTVLTCNVPHEVVFRASRSNNFYFALLLIMLFLCVLPVAYAIVLLSPSWHCGPFSNHDKIYYLFTNATMDLAPQFTHEFFYYLASPAAVIPLLVLLILIIYYLVSLTGSLREANHDLRSQLRKERTEERKKMWKLAEEQTKGPTNGPNVLSARWKKVLEGSQSPSPDNKPGDGKVEARKELLARIMKKALRKESATSDEDSQATDTEMQESLPHDQPEKKAAKQKFRNPFAQIIALAKAQDSVAPENKENRENSRRESAGDTENEKIVAERRRSILKRQENIPDLRVVDEKGQKKPSKDDPPLVFKFDESLPSVAGSPRKKGKKDRRARCSPHHESEDESDVSKQNSPHYVAPKFTPEPPPEYYEDPVKLTKFTPVPDTRGDPIYAQVKKPVKDLGEEVPKTSTSLESSDKDFHPSESSEDRENQDYAELKTPPPPSAAVKIETKKSSPKKELLKNLAKVSPAEKPVKVTKQVEKPGNKRSSVATRRDRMRKHRIKSDRESSPIHEEREKSLERPESPVKPAEKQPKKVEKGTKAKEKPKKEDPRSRSKSKSKERNDKITPEPSPVPEPEPPQDPKALQKKKKFNNFFSLMKEAVQSKLQEPKPDEPEGAEALPEVTPVADPPQSKVPEASTYPRRGSKKSEKRQDSMTSIWSDNIPVITISKTESDENILQEGQGTVKRKQKGKEEPEKGSK